MKKLHLIRHGKSNWKDLELNDFNRPLKKRGIKNSKEIAQVLKDRNCKPDLILSSPAVRAFDTAKLIADSLELSENQFKIKDQLYMPDFPSLLKTVLYLENDWNEVIIVGHEPSFSGLVNHFITSPIDKLITASLTSFEFDTSDWKGITSGNLISATHTNRHDYAGFELH